MSISAEDKRVRDIEAGRSYDSAQQRITELYSKAVEQLGHEKAPVRLGGFYSLERLAQDNAEHRQTVVDVICAYLRMPFTFDPYSSRGASNADDYQEYEVRKAAQNLLIRHISWPMEPVPGEEAWAQPDEPPEIFWKDVQLDLRGASLIDLDLTLCVPYRADFSHAIFRGETRFWRTRFDFMIDFTEAKFLGKTGFGRARFNAEGDFRKAEFHEDVEFNRAVFDAHGLFEEARFLKDASFYFTEFNYAAYFDEALFKGIALFDAATFVGPNIFDTTHFEGTEPSFSDVTVRARNAQRWPPPWQLETSTDGEGRLVRVPPSTGPSSSSPPPSS